MADYTMLLLVFAPALALVRRLVTGTMTAVAIALAITAMAVVPLGQTSVDVYLRGLFGDLSMPSVALLAVWAFSSMKPIQSDESQKLIACSVIGATGLCFYLTALGLGTFDPYTLGFDPLPLAAVIALACLVSIWIGWYVAALCLLAALIGYQLQVLPSHNLWDYLLDPLLWMFSLGYAGVRIWRRYRGTSRSA